MRWRWRCVHGVSKCEEVENGASSVRISPLEREGGPGGYQAKWRRSMFVVKA